MQPENRDFSLSVGRISLEAEAREHIQEISRDLPWPRWVGRIKMRPTLMPRGNLRMLGLEGAGEAQTMSAGRRGGVSPQSSSRDSFRESVLSSASTVDSSQRPLANSIGMRPVARKLQHGHTGSWSLVAPCEPSCFSHRQPGCSSGAGDERLSPIFGKGYCPPPPTSRTPSQSQTTI